MNSAPDTGGGHAFYTASHRAVKLVSHVCSVAGSLTFLDDIRQDLNRDGVLDAVARRDTPTIFNWLLATFSYQGSDQVARNYIRQHGNASWVEIAEALKGVSPCPLLRSHWEFDGCRFDKTSFTCSEPDRIGHCPLPRHRLRNGRLNQMAYSFYLFARDIAGGDLVSWIDRRLISPGPMDEWDTAQERLIDPLRHVYGVSDKILTMTLSGLLLSASDGRPKWFEAGKDMIAIDTLVHNFLHRTGILTDGDAEHGYGVGCYAPGGCADIVRAIAAQIDARTFNADYPASFPRFVQHAIWRYCAADGLDVCNGNRIDDRKSCEYNYCYIRQKCSKNKLNL
jgi:hypothetical protein